MTACYCELPYSECADSQSADRIGNNRSQPDRSSHMRPAPRFRPLPLLAALLWACATPAMATEPAADTAKPKTTQELLDASLPTDWRSPDPANTLYMELAGG